MGPGVKASGVKYHNASKDPNGGDFARPLTALAATCGHDKGDKEFGGGGELGPQTRFKLRTTLGESLDKPLNSITCCVTVGSCGQLVPRNIIEKSSQAT